MNVAEMSLKAAVTVSEMAEMCSISRSRWYELVASGIFPEPIQLPSMKRPAYDRTLQEKCLEIRATGIGMNDVLVVFNRKPKRNGQAKQKAQRPAKDKSQEPIIEEVLDGVKRLGYAATTQAVSDAVAALCPAGVAAGDLEKVIAKVFLHLQSPKK